MGVIVLVVRAPKEMTSGRFANDSFALVQLDRSMPWTPVHGGLRCGGKYRQDEFEKGIPVYFLIEARFYG